MLSAARGQPAWGIAAATAVIALHFLLSDQRRVDAALLLMALAIGLAFMTPMLTEAARALSARLTTPR